MGSFDEAIRQHLDLKRRQGADPREVAHLEREALGPDETADIGSAPEPLDTSSAVLARRPYDVEAPIDEPVRQTRLGTLNEETQEIDMAVVLAASEPSVPPGSQAAQAYDWSADLQSPDIGDPLSSFEWEMPSRGHLRKAA